jgi:hypothetical protein
MYKLFTLIFLLSIFSCTDPDKTISTAKDIALKKFIARQRLVNLPIHFDLDHLPDSLTQPMIVDASDSLFISPDLASGRIYGLYKDTSNFFLFINFGAASVYIPEILVLDKKGNQIHNEQLLICAGGADCGYYYSSISNIYRNTTRPEIKFNVRDSMYLYTCDSLGKETPGTLEHYVQFLNGTIDISGNVSVITGSINYVR